MTESQDQRFGPVAYHSAPHTIREQAGRQQPYAVYTREGKEDVLDYFASTLLAARYWIINREGAA